MLLLFTKCQFISLVFRKNIMLTICHVILVAVNNFMFVTKYHLPCCEDLSGLTVSDMDVVKQLLKDTWTPRDITSDKEGQKLVTTWKPITASIISILLSQRKLSCCPILLANDSQLSLRTPAAGFLRVLSTHGKYYYYTTNKKVSETRLCVRLFKNESISSQQ